MRGADFTVRQAREGDLSALPGIERAAATLFKEAGIEGLDEATLTPAESLRQGLEKGRLWVAEADGNRIAGFALAGTAGGNAHLEEMDVHPEFGRRGIGRALLEVVCAWARGAGYAAITLTTMDNVPWNAPFYESAGFRVLDRDGLTEALRDILREEVRRGMPPEHRVAMLRDLG